MYKYDVIQIVDLYGRYGSHYRRTIKNDLDAEVQSLSLLIKSLGRNVRKIAIVPPEDDRSSLAYDRAGYEIVSMNTDRAASLRQFIRQMISQIQHEPPKHLVLVTEDPEFVPLCDEVESLTNVAVWADSATCPRELQRPEYNWTPLEDLLPNLRIPRIDVRIDLENILVGLVQRGWRPNLREMMEAIRLATGDLGEIVAVTAYADFDELNRHHGGPHANWQRDLTLAGGESRYVINQHGKNTADMRIANDIRTVMEDDAAAHRSADIICLVTLDRDFRYVLETARVRGKRVVVLGLEGVLSPELEHAASDVRYLNSFLGVPTSKTQSSPPLRVFLCHSTNDKSTVRTLYHRLSSDKYDPWLDEENLVGGQDWDREIRKAVRTSDVVIVCLSRGSTTKSGYIQKEIKFALDVADEQPEDKIFLIPLKLEECSVPDRLAKWHWVSLFEEDGYERLLRALGSVSPNPSTTR